MDNLTEASGIKASATAVYSVELKSSPNFKEKMISERNSVNASVQSQEEGLLFELLGIKEESKSPSGLTYSSKLKLFEPVWDLTLSIQAYEYIKKLTDKKNCIEYLIELIKGKFTIINKLEYFYLITPMYLKNTQSNSQLISLIIGENRNENNLKLLVCKKNKYGELKLTDQEFLYSMKLDKLDSYNCTNLLNGDKENGYSPKKLFFKKTSENIVEYKNIKLPKIKNIHSRKDTVSLSPIKLDQKCTKVLNKSTDESSNKTYNNKTLRGVVKYPEKKLPKYALKTKKIHNTNKTLYLLINLTDKNYENCKVTISKVKNFKTEPEECSNYILSGLKYKLIKITTLIIENATYTLELKIKTEYGGYKNYTEKSTRKFKSSKFQFIFDVNFKLGADNVINTKISLLNPYQQLLLYLNHLKDFDEFECLFNDFRELKMKQKSIFINSNESQNEIVNYISMELEKNEDKDEEDNKRIYYNLCVLALIDSFPINQRDVNTESLEKFANLVENHPNLYLKTFDIYKNSDLAMEGIAKMIAYASMKNINNFNASLKYPNCKSYESLITIYLKLLQENNLLRSEYLNTLLECFKQLCGGEYESLFLRSFQILTDLKEKINFIMSKVGLKVSNSIKCQLIQLSLKTDNLSLNELVELLKYFSDKNIYDSKLIRTQDILGLIIRHLPVNKKIPKDEFKPLKSLVKLIKVEQSLSGFNIKEFLKKQNKFYDSPIFYYKLKVEDELIPELFYTWLKSRFPRPHPKDWIIILDEHLKPFKNLQGPISRYFLEQYSDIKLFNQKDYITKLESNNLKRNFKIIFKKRFLILFKDQINEDYNKIPNIMKHVSTIDAWMYFGELIEFILDKSNLKEILKYSEQNLCDFRGVLESKDWYLKKIYVVVESMEFWSPFCILLGKKISELSFGFNVEDYARICKMFMDFIEEYKQKNKNILLIISISRVKHYLNIFATLLLLNSNEREDTILHTENCMRNLFNERKLPIFELYLLKIIKRLQVENSQNLIGSFLKDDFEILTKYQNIFPCLFQHNLESRKNAIRSHKFELFPMSKKIADSSTYKNLRIKILNLSNNRNLLDEEIKNLINDDAKFQFGIAFLNYVYLMHAHENFNNSPYVEWFNNKQNMLEDKLGTKFVVLLKLFIDNFPDNCLCYLHPNIDKKNLTIAILISYLSLIAICHTTKTNQFSCQFFESDGSLFKSISKKSKEIYYIGAEIPKIQDHLVYMNQDFEKLRNINPFMTGAGSYVCSDTCDFFYIIDKCGGAFEIKECPICKNSIGGTDHNIVIREGHRILADDEARKFLKNKCDQYKANEPVSFEHYSNNIPMNLIRKLRLNMTFSLLNFFTNSVFYFLHLTKLYATQEINEVYKIENNLKTEIEKILNEDYTVIESSINEIDYEYLIIEFVNNFKDLILDYKGDSNSKPKRDFFEEEFDKKITAQSFTEQISKYKTYMGSLNSSNPSININELIPEEKKKFSDLFFFNLKPSWELMKKSFKLIREKKMFPILNSFIENYEELQSLRLLWPIMNFSKKIINILDSKYSRNEASNIPIHHILDYSPELRDCFEQFLKAWQFINGDLYAGCLKLQKFEITDETPVGYFLIDSLINSQGLVLLTAIKNLIEIQNRVLPLFQTKTELKEISFVKTLEENIFYLNPDRLESIIQTCSFNSLKKGEESEIDYDYQDLCFYLSQHLKKAKVIKTESLNCFNYLFETFNPRSYCFGSLIRLNEKIFQLPLEKSETDYIENTIKSISERENKDVSLVWKEVYIFLGKLIVFSETQDIRKNELSKVIENFKSNHIFWKCEFSELFKMIDKRKLIKIYECIEMKMFDFALNSIDCDYKKKLSDVELSELNQFIQELTCDELIECLNAIKRIIIRLLTAKPEKSESIYCYLVGDIFWSFEFKEKASSLSEKLPKTFQMKHIVEIEKILEMH